MKKLVLALFAAAAMIFGLAGCSGDLHDSAFFDAYTDGFSMSGAAGNQWSGTWENTVSKVDTYSCKYTFTANAAQATDGVMVGIKGPKGGWTNRYEITGTHAVGDTVECQTTEPSIRGTYTVVEGTTYTVTVKYDTSTKKVYLTLR